MGPSIFHLSPQKHYLSYLERKCWRKVTVQANDHFYPSSLSHLRLTQKNLPSFLSSLNHNFISLLFNIENNFFLKYLIEVSSIENENAFSQI